MTDNVACPVDETRCMVTKEINHMRSNKPTFPQTYKIFQLVFFSSCFFFFFCGGGLGA